MGAFYTPQLSSRIACRISTLPSVEELHSLIVVLVQPCRNLPLMAFYFHSILIAKQYHSLRMHTKKHLHHEKISFFAYSQTKPKISCALTTQLISNIIFVTWIVQSLYFLNPISSLYLSSVAANPSVCIVPGLKPQRQIEMVSYKSMHIKLLLLFCLFVFLPVI